MPHKDNSWNYTEWVGVIGTISLNMLVVHLNPAGEPMVAPIYTKIKLLWLQINGEKNSVSFDKQTQTYVSSVYMFLNIVSAYTYI